MNATTPSRERLTDLTGDSTYLGTDADGNDHYWYSTRHVAWIVDDDGDIQMPQRVADLGEYVAHVRDVAGGWEDLQYDGRSMQELVDDLADGIEVRA
ncbi:hypothetical protein Hbl1158_02835 [Halobaculum sp. CBA1158]|uniref:hypothetical protein n=1 Tax=Halobaculum sp. CBA1158 TaxID=2904243 RepID=UPI001F3F53D4|nr:hypothetical protein [Halobaculum sp. CBA1158]UIP00322.1 hypothetical protein Hbl1158_02835 [Halobaculum sp. CBA1158]